MSGGTAPNFVCVEERQEVRGTPPKGEVGAKDLDRWVSREGDNRKGSEWRIRGRQI